jgi:hypothetical protein
MSPQNKPMLMGIPLGKNAMRVSKSFALMSHRASVANSAPRGRRRKSHLDQELEGANLDVFAYLQRLEGA